MPNKFYAYYKLMRLGNPTGYLLVFFPALFGIFLATKNCYDLQIIPLFLIGSILSRSAGCIINDIIDRKLDKHVERTKDRPITSGALSIKEALIALYLVLFACLSILLSLTITSIIIGFIAFCLILIYPLMKRITYFPQAFLGITFNLGCLIGYTALVDYVSYQAMIMYLGCCFWTIGYDTIYAFMDIKDDKRIGIKSTAVFFENKSYHCWITIFYIIFIASFININLFNDRYVAIIGGLISSVLLFWQAKTLDINSSENCLIRFKNNVYVGAILSMAMLIDYMIHMCTLFF